MKKLKIAYITTYDATDVNNWSGLGYYIAKTLEKHVGDIEYVGNLNYRQNAVDYFNKTMNRFLFKKHYIPDRTENAGLQYARQVEEKLKGKFFDLIFSPGTVPIAYLETKIPIIFWTDANFQGMIDYYFKNLCNETIGDGNLMEKTALEKSALAIYSSEWAANGAVEFYDVNPKKVKVIPFGANVSDVPVENEIRRKLNEKIKLLFVGRDWERKGGKIVFDTMKELNKRDIDTSLIVVGCIPPQTFMDEKMLVIPSLDKNKKEDAEILRNLYITSDFFIMPSRKECYGVVFCEAAAFGLPVISSITGGITTIVKEGVNGFLLPLEEEGKTYADKVIEIIEKGKYEQLCISSRKRYDEVLNWDAAGMELKSMVSIII